MVKLVFPTWGYDRIAGALANLGHKVSDQTVGNILEENGIPPTPEREPGILWSNFIKSHEEVLAACDFFTVEVITPVGLVTYYVLFVINIGSRELHIAGVTPYPTQILLLFTQGKERLGGLLKYYKIRIEKRVDEHGRDSILEVTH
ncbi:MAG: hypothetical protein GY869_25185 [Planctomycetes bacterium]|nr:hypothetical protein [Planctomycetota bacterium]